MNSEVGKIAIAVEYLETASTLWLEGERLFSSLHLAAAAEEISGKTCRIDGVKSHSDDLIERVKKTLSALGISYTKKQILEAFFGVKNSVKHMDGASDGVVMVDAREESAHFIIAAYRNFQKLGLEDQLSRSVLDVLDANIILIEVGDEG